MIKKKLIIAFILFLFTSCNSQKKKQLEEVSIVLDWYPNAVHTFIYTALANGYFKDEGIDLKILYPSSPSDSLVLPAAKKADIGISYLNTVIIAKTNENIPIQSFGAILQQSVNTVISLKEKNITSPKDFTNKRAGSSGGLLSDVYLNTMMKHKGVSPNSLEVIDVGFELLTSMITDQVDFTIGGMLNHEIPVMKDKGIDINYFLIEEFGIPQSYELILVANEELLKEKTATYQKVVNILKKGFQDVKNNPQKSIDILLSKQASEQFPLTENVEKQSLTILLPLMENNTSSFLNQKEEIWENNINWLFENQIISKKIPAKNFIYQF